VAAAADRLGCVVCDLLLEGLGVGRGRRVCVVDRGAEVAAAIGGAVGVVG
jgi:hypothetical protein